MRIALVLLLLATVAGAPSRASAQATTYAETTGLTWGVAAFELGLLATVAGAAILAAERSPDTQPFAVYGLAISAVLGAVAAAVAQALAAPVEPAMLFHHGFTGGVLIGGLASSALAAGGARDEMPAWFGLGALVVGAAGAVTYSALRMDRLAHDPHLVEEAHALSWVPLPAAGIVAAVVALAGAPQAAPILGALAGIVAYAIAVGFVEDAIASHPAP